MKNFKRSIDKIQTLNSEEWHLLQDIISRKKVKAKEQLVVPGQIPRYMYFVETGLLRVFHLNEGKEINTYFACDGQFISTFASFITQTPSNEYMESIEEGLVYEISHEKLNQLYLQYPKFEKFGRYYAEQSYLCVINRTVDMLNKKSKERYEDFIQNHEKKIVQRTPLKHIASYIGIEPESLSRIRKEYIIS
jgi:CRP-like cAMP-binding protein